MCQGIWGPGILPDGSLFDMSAEGEDVKFKMSCGHEGQMNMDWLRKHCYSSHTLQTTIENSIPDTSRLVSRFQLMSVVFTGF